MPSQSAQATESAHNHLGCSQKGTIVCKTIASPERSKSPENFADRLVWVNQPSDLKCDQSHIIILLADPVRALYRKWWF